MAQGFPTAAGGFTKGFLGGLEIRGRRAERGLRREELQLEKSKQSILNISKNLKGKSLSQQQRILETFTTTNILVQSHIDTLKTLNEDDTKIYSDGITAYDKALKAGDEDAAALALATAESVVPEGSTMLEAAKNPRAASAFIELSKIQDIKRNALTGGQPPEGFETLLNQEQNLKEQLISAGGGKDGLFDKWLEQEKELNAATLKASGVGAKPTRSIKTVPDETSSTGFRFKDILSGEEFDEAPKPSSLVKIDLPRPISASERTAIAEGEAAIDSLINIRSLFDEKFVGPVAGRAGVVGDLFGTNTQEQSEFIAATAAFKNQIIKEITGAQMSEVEAKRILKQVPDLNNPPTVWMARWEQSLRNIERLQKRRVEILRRTFGDKPEEDLSGLSDADLLKQLGGE